MEVITKVPCTRDKYVPPHRVRATVAVVGEGQKQNLPVPTAFRGVLMVLMTSRGNSSG